MKSRVVGILGGMGPAATADFYLKLIAATPAPREQDHLRVVMWADPTIPDRQAAILRGGADPRAALERGVDILIAAGAEILVVPCNTAHAFLDEIVAGRPIEFVSMIDATVDAVVGLAGPSSSRRAGLLATDGAVACGIYQAALAEAGIETLVPSADSQGALTPLVAAVKTGLHGPDQVAQLERLIGELGNRGADSVILGCTELSVLAAQVHVPVPVVDPSQVLAELTVICAHEFV